MTTILDLKTLQHAVAGGAAAIRAITRLESAGGPGDKVFPPTYVKEGRSQTKYAMEKRIIEGREVQTVLLDSVASQANRMEEALLEGHRRNELSFPLIEVVFTGENGLEDLDTITSLEAPHRIADALLRDSLLDGKPFRFTTVGSEFSDARPKNATGMYKHCPTALLFGCWDSTGPKGGLGAKFARCIVSEIVGIEVVTGVKTASRIDPAGIEKSVGAVYQSNVDAADWTTILSEAAVDKHGKPIEFSRTGSDGKKGTPATINHGNIPPSIDGEAGGVTMDRAVQTIVLSLAGLRRLRFQTRVDGQRIDGALRQKAEDAARTALAALGLAAIVYQRENDFDLRSRALLIAKNALTFELLGRDGAPPATFTLDRAGANALVAAANAEAAKCGLGWVGAPVRLTPTPKLASLIRVSRDHVAAGGEES